MISNIRQGRRNDNNQICPNAIAMDTIFNSPTVASPGYIAVKDIQRERYWRIR